MARVTVEDCIKFVPNRFELVIMAARRARQLSRGSESKLSADRDKFTVLALREIGEGYITPANLMEEESRLVACAVVDMDDEIDEETRALMAEEMQVPGVVGEDLAEFEAANDGDESSLGDISTEMALMNSLDDMDENADL